MTLRSSSFARAVSCMGRAAGVPAFAPVGGTIYFEDVQTTNTPQQALLAATSLYSTAEIQGLYNNYSGLACFPAETGFDGCCMASSGHGPMFQPLWRYERGTKTYSFKCIPTRHNLEGEPTDALFRFTADLTLPIEHGYTADQYMPAYGGKGPRWVRLGSYSSPHIVSCLEISDPSGVSGLSRLNSTPFVYNGLTQSQFPYPLTAHWPGIGYFMLNNTSNASKTVFIAYDGTVDLTTYAGVNSNFGSSMVIDVAHNHLIGFVAGNVSRPSSTCGYVALVSLSNDSTRGTRLATQLVLDSAGINDLPSTYSQHLHQKFGWAWVPELDCAIGYYAGAAQGPDPATGNLGGNAGAGFYRLRPSNPVNRTGAPWVIEALSIAHNPADVGGRDHPADLKSEGLALAYEGRRFDWDPVRKQMTVHVLFNGKPQVYDFSSY